MVDGQPTLASVVASTDDAVIGETTDGKVFCWNAGAERVFGYAAEEMVGRPTSLLVPGHEAGDWSEVLERLRRGERVPTHEAWRARKDGRLILVSQTVSAIRGPAGRPAGFSIVARDTTRQAREEEARGMLAALVEGSHDAILSLTLDGIIVSWNGGAEEVYGYSAAEALGLHARFLVPEARQHEVQRNLDRVRRGQRVEPYETVRRRKDGREVAVSLRASPIRDARGNVLGVSSIARDITRLKEEQAERLRHAERIAAMERERAAQLARQQLVRSTAAEANAPLTPILLQLELLRADGRLTAEHRRSLAILDRNAERLRSLIQQLLAASSG